MAVYTIKILSVCAAGNHVGIQIKRDGANFRTLTLDKDIILGPTTPPVEDLDGLVTMLMRDAALSAAATTPAQAKTAIEAKTWNF